MNSLTDLTPIAWLIAGMLLGVLHTTTLWRTAGHGASPWLPLTGLARLIALGVVFAGAALNGGILPVAAGWAIGFVTTLGAVLLQKQFR